MVFLRGIWLILTLFAFAGFLIALGRLAFVREALLHEAKLYGSLRWDRLGWGVSDSAAAQAHRKAARRAGVLALCCFAVLGVLIGLSYLIF